MLNIGRFFYAAAIIFFGAQHLIHGKFVTRVMPPWPGETGTGGPWVVGLVLIFAGVALCFRRTARWAALWLGAQTLLGAVLLALPAAVAGAAWGGAWTMAGKAIVLGGGALLVAGILNKDQKGSGWLLLAGRIGLSGFFILGGIQHFIWVKFVMQLVPAWIPGAQFWAYFTGVALIAGGVGLLIPRTARLAAWLSAGMVFSWVLLLHLPRTLSASGNANEATALFEALAMSGMALVLACFPPDNIGRAIKP